MSKCNTVFLSPWAPAQSILELLLQGAGHVTHVCEQRAPSFLSQAETREKQQKELFYLILLLHAAVQSWLPPGGFSALAQSSRV